MTIQDEVFPRLSAIKRSDEVWHRGLRREDFVVFAARIKVLCNIVHDLGRIPGRILARNTNHLLYKPDNVALPAGATLLQIGTGLCRHMGLSAILRLAQPRLKSCANCGRQGNFALLLLLFRLLTPARIVKHHDALFDLPTSDHLVAWTQFPFACSHLVASDQGLTVGGSQDVLALTA
jgi:hypothetical protein